MAAAYTWRWVVCSLVLRFRGRVVGIADALLACKVGSRNTVKER